MKKTFYYLAILLPLLIIYQLMVINVSNALLIFVFCSYIFIYRPLIDYCELVRNGIPRNEAKKIFIPFKSAILRYKYFKELYFK